MSYQSIEKYGIIGDAHSAGCRTQSGGAVSGWLERLLTHTVKGLENYAGMIQLPTEKKSAIKAFVEVSSDR